MPATTARVFAAATGINENGVVRNLTCLTLDWGVTRAAATLELRVWRTLGVDEGDLTGENTVPAALYEGIMTHTAVATTVRFVRRT